MSQLIPAVLFATGASVSGYVSSEGKMSPGSEPGQGQAQVSFFIINLVRMFAWADSRDQSLHYA